MNYFLLFICVTIITLIITISITIYNNDRYKSNPHIVDIVYTWVEADEKFEKEKKFWLEKENNFKNIDISLSNETIRFESNEELKYSIRSLEKYFPHYNNIYIIVKDGQYPKFLDFTNPKIKLVFHSQIIPADYLPTYNSMSIELYLHHIPNLSEYYLYLNDDFMFLKKLDISYFMNRNNVLYLNHDTSKYKLTDEMTKYVKNDKDNYEFKSGWCYNNLLLDTLGKPEKDGRYVITHMPKMYKKSYDNILEQILKNHYNEGETINCFDKTGMSKFRKNSNLFLVAIVKDYLYKYMFDTIEKKSKLYLIDMNNKKPVNMNAIKNSEFLCIASVTSSGKDEYRKLMNEIYPDKSSFEK